MRYACLVVLCGCLGVQEAPDPVNLLASASSEDRLHGFFLLDRQQMSEHIPELTRLAQTDPSPDVRREVIRQLGYTGDASLVDFLEGMLDSDFSEEAAESLGYLGPPGCEVLARRWAEAERDAYGWSDARLHRSLSFAFQIKSPECLSQLARVGDRHPAEFAKLTVGLDFYLKPSTD